MGELVVLPERLVDKLREGDRLRLGEECVAPWLLLMVCAAPVPLPSGNASPFLGVRPVFSTSNTARAALAFESLARHAFAPPPAAPTDLRVTTFLLALSPNCSRAEISGAARGPPPPPSLLAPFRLGGALGAFAACTNLGALGKRRESAERCSQSASMDDVAL